ncbi:hypothetical protein [Synoicihabitans lomoniglobus]|uniref:Uncharacterized protein n=1 Tax=Synoicihabitans lomoniglobus TaxID=2909285 RepID=A0AAF0CR76_9BACT|nr:hypothetical protein [Opitutaceae bacterium LMO-M01]WED66544.1 hypothetical protein PXH66_06735 [Opitutaceae bacterium LMO-M01]
MIVGFINFIKALFHLRSFTKVKPDGIQRALHDAYVQSDEAKARAKLAALTTATARAARQDGR